MPCSSVQVWREYDEGLNGKPALKRLEEETKGKWRKQHHRAWNIRMTLINLITESAAALNVPAREAALRWSKRQAEPERLTLNKIYETATQLRNTNNGDALARWLAGTPAWDLGVKGDKLTCAAFKKPSGGQGTPAGLQVGSSTVCHMGDSRATGARAGACPNSSGLASVCITASCGTLAHTSRLSHVLRSR